MLNRRCLMELIEFLGVARTANILLPEEVVGRLDRAIEDVRRELTSSITEVPEWVFSAVKLVYENEGKLEAIRLLRRCSGHTLIECKSLVEDKSWNWKKKEN